MAFAGRELRTGAWTRLGDSAVLGDAATEHTLSGLAEQAQAAARAQGYSTGWAEGRRAADERAEEHRRELVAEHRAQEARREAEHRVAVDALTRAATGFTDALASVCAQVAAHTTEIAVALTEELLGHELAVASAPGVDAVHRALDLVPAEAVVKVRLCPDEASDPVLAELPGPVTVVADPSLRRGDALVETVDGIVHARVSGAISRVREVLAP
jgi:flagellar assembly protein FliH